MRIALSPDGPTRRMSKSSGFAWSIPERVTVTLVMLPDNPETAMGEGYGFAAPEVADLGTAIKELLLKVPDDVLLTVTELLAEVAEFPAAS